MGQVTSYSGQVMISTRGNLRGVCTESLVLIEQPEEINL